ncbi:MAG: hypothetical protein LBL67_04590 [Coriobacteriales bacterium]|jgi:hypothetical protein|nr:hypothetical protein [Coriobacteriales bacterium]
MISLRHRLARRLRSFRHARAALCAFLALVLIAALFFTYHNWRQPAGFANTGSLDFTVSGRDPASGPSAGGNTVTLDCSGLGLGIGSYVQDPTFGDNKGKLLAMYDGIDNVGTLSDSEHSDTTTTWKDLIGDHDLTRLAESGGYINSNYDWGSNYAKFDGTSTGEFAYTASNLFDLSGYTHFVIEARFANPSGSYGRTVPCFLTATDEDQTVYNVHNSFGMMTNNSTWYNYGPNGAQQPTPAYGGKGVNGQAYIGNYGGGYSGDAGFIDCNLCDSNGNNYGGVYKNTGAEGSQWGLNSTFNTDSVSYSTVGDDKATGVYRNAASASAATQTLYAQVNTGSATVVNPTKTSYPNATSYASTNSSISTSITGSSYSAASVTQSDLSHEYLFINNAGNSHVATPGSNQGCSGAGVLELQSLRIYGYDASVSNADVAADDAKLAAANYAVDEARFVTGSTGYSGTVGVRLGSSDSGVATNATVTSDGNITFTAPSAADAGATSDDNTVKIYVNEGGGSYVDTDLTYTYNFPTYKSIGFSYSTASGAPTVLNNDTSTTTDINQETSTDAPCVALFQNSGTYNISTDASWTGPASNTNIDTNQAFTPDSTITATYQHSIKIAADKDVTLHVTGDLNCEQGAGLGLAGIELGAGASLTLDIDSGKSVTCVGSAANAATTGTPAGVEVPKGASFTLSGAGKLVATGGAIAQSYIPSSDNYCGTGSGIGSAGYYPAGVGSIDLKGSGAVYATGGALGDTTKANNGYGSGAGIGSGGAASGSGSTVGSSGSISIESACNVVANGGVSCNRSGAGIGSGGWSNDYTDTHVFDLTIDTTGKVLAKGGTCVDECGAGIGTGGMWAGNSDGTTQNMPAVTIEKGDVLAQGGVGDNYGAAAGIGTGALAKYGTCKNFAVNISGGTVVAESSLTSSQDPDDLAQGIGGGYDGYSDKAITVDTATSSLVITGGSVLAINPADTNANKVFMTPTNGSASVYPVYVAASTNDPALTATDGYTFSNGSYRATAYNWLGTGSFSYTDANGSAATASFTPVQHPLTTSGAEVTNQVNAVMWLPTGTRTFSATNGQTTIASDLYAHVNALTLPGNANDQGKTPPIDTSTNWVYYSTASPLADDEGFLILPYDGVTGVDATHTLEIAPGADTTYKICTDSSWTTTGSHWLPDHNLVIAPPAGVTVTLEVVDTSGATALSSSGHSGASGLDMEPGSHGLVSAANQGLPGINVKSGSLDLDIESGVTVTAIGQAETSAHAAVANSYVGSPAGVGVLYGATFKVSGSGSLVATGGAQPLSGTQNSGADQEASGAGIGGQGNAGSGTTAGTEDTANDVGTIVIGGSATVYATGGQLGTSSDFTNASAGTGTGLSHARGSGAGIGSGGAGGRANNTHTAVLGNPYYAGTIDIEDAATVIAQGGASCSRSGAGIGCGAETIMGDTTPGGHFAAQIDIDTSGKVVAQGGTIINTTTSGYAQPGAGIGSGGIDQGNEGVVRGVKLDVEDGQVLAKGGTPSSSEGPYYCAAGIGAGASNFYQGSTINGQYLQVHISGGSVVAEASLSPSAYGCLSYPPYGIGGSSVINSTTSGVTFYESTSTLTNSLVVTGGSLYMDNPNDSDPRGYTGAVIANLTDIDVPSSPDQSGPSDGSGNPLYPVYVASKLPYDATGSAASTNGVTFSTTTTSGAYSATAYDWVGEGSFSYPDSSGSGNDSLSFTKLPTNGSYVNCQVDAIMWLPANTTPGGTKFTANGGSDFIDCQGLAATVYAQAYGNQGSSASTIPTSTSLNFVYPDSSIDSGSSYVGYVISPTTGVTGNESDNTLTIAPASDTTYTILDQPGLGGGSWTGANDTTNDILPRHCIIIAPTATNVTVTLRVVGATTAEPVNGSGDYQTSNPNGITISSSYSGTVLDLDVASGQTLRVKGDQNPNGDGFAGIAVNRPTTLDLTGQGTLYATGSDYAPAIGAQSGQSAGTINISSGTLVASVPSTSYAAAIGGSTSYGKAPTASGALSITGGTVVAYSAATSNPYTGTLTPYNVAATSLTVSNADFLCVGAGGAAPSFTGASPESAVGSTALYPCYVPDTWSSGEGDSGTVSVPDGVPGQGAYNAPLADLATLLNTGVSGSATDSLTQADGLAACLWLPGSSYVAGSSTYDNYNGITLTDSSGMSITPDSGLLANVDAKQKAFGPATTAGTAEADHTNLVEPPSLSLSGGKPLVSLTPSADDLAQASPVFGESESQVHSNLASGYQVQLRMADGQTTALQGTSDSANLLEALGSDKELERGDSDGVWAYFLDGAESASPITSGTDINTWWAPSTTTSAAHTISHAGPALGNSADPAGTANLWFGLCARSTQAPDHYVGTVLETVSPGL